MHKDDNVMRGNEKNQVSEKMENVPELYSRKKSEYKYKPSPDTGPFVSV